jgi:hypothetical protein
MHFSSLHTCYVPRPSHSSYHHWNNIWWRAQFFKLLIMQFVPVSCHFNALMFKYSHQYPVIKYPTSASVLTSCVWHAFLRRGSKAVGPMS